MLVIIFFYGFFVPPPPLPLFFSWVDSRTGTSNFLSGRYSRVLLELDLDEGIMRVVEAAGKYTGPCLRALSTITAFNGTVVVFGGYTTLDPAEDRYGTAGVRAFGDMYTCRILKIEEAKVLVTNHQKTMQIRQFNIADLLSKWRGVCLS